LVAPGAVFPSPRGGPTYGWKAIKAIEDSSAMRVIVSLFFVLLLLSGCDGPRSTMVPKDQALRDERVLRVRVVAVYDNRNADYTTEFNVSHVIDVDVLAGPDDLIGKPLALPFDIFYVAKLPPQAGEEVVTSPSAWVMRNRGGKARGFGQ